MIPSAGNMIRSVAISVCILATLAVTSPATADGDCAKLVFQGKLQGRIEDCGCPKAPLGGLERRAVLMAEIHESCESVLAFDAGNMIGPIQDGMQAQSAFLAAENARLGYGPAGIGAEDLHYGLDFLRQLESDHGLQFTSANLTAEGETLFPAYLIQEVAGIRVGLVSVLSPQAELVSDAGDLQGVEITEPAAALRTLLPTLTEESDVVVLLANLPKNDSHKLVRELKAESGIDIMIEGDSTSHYGKALTVHGVKVMAANPRGKYLGEIRLGLADGSWNGEIEYVQHDVDSREPGDEAMAARIREFLDSNTVATGSR